MREGLFIPGVEPKGVVIPAWCWAVMGDRKGRGGKGTGLRERRGGKGRQWREETRRQVPGWVAAILG